MKRIRCVGLVVVSAVFLSAGVASAVSLNWSNTTGGGWENAGNWTPGGTPSSTNRATITNSATYTVTVGDNAANTDPAGNASWMTVGGDVGGAALQVGGSPGGITLLVDYTNTGKILVFTNYGANVNACLLGVTPGIARLTVNSGSVEVRGPAPMRVGTVPDSDAAIQLNGGSLIGTNSATQTLIFGSLFSSGVLDVAAGTVLWGPSAVYLGGSGATATNAYGKWVARGSSTNTVGSELRVGFGPQSVGRVEVQDSALFTCSKLSVAGESPSPTSTGEVVVTGGYLVQTNTGNYNWKMGSASNTLGRLTVSNGVAEIRTGFGYIGDTAFGRGELNVFGGSFVATNAGTLYLGNAAKSEGTMSIRGGTATVSKIFYVGYSGKGTLDVSGGSTIVGVTYVGYNAGASGSVVVSGGVLQVVGNNVRLGGTAGSTGTVTVTGGEFTATNTTDQNNPFAIGYSGYGRMETWGGVVRGKNVEVGRQPGSIGEWIILGGSNYVIAGTAFEIANRNNSCTGLLLVAGGVLESEQPLTMGDGTTNSSRFIVSNGVVTIPTVSMIPAGEATASCVISGGSNNFGSLFVNLGRAGLASALFDGGVLWVSNMTVRSLVTQIAQVAVSNNGLIYAKFLSVGGDAGGSGLGNMVVAGGRVVVSNALYVGSIRASCTGTVAVAGSGVLEMWGAITNGSATPGSGKLTVRDGGALRFAGANNPAITLGAGGSLLATNAVVEFMSASAASLTGNAASKIAYAGTNTLSLNNATNAWVTNYQFGPSPATNFLHLALSNGGVFQGTNTTFAPGSILTIQLGGTALSQIGRVVDAAALALGGATLNVTLAEGYIPQNGNIFDILDWSSGPGSFGAVNLPALPGGLTWNDSQLYVNGQVSVRASSPGALILVR